jgi:hypothetical protein
LGISRFINKTVRFRLNILMANDSYLPKSKILRHGIFCLLLWELNYLVI